MPLKIYKCETCGHVVRTLKNLAMPPQCAHGKENPDLDKDYEYMEELFEAPEAKMLETIDKETGKTRLKDQMKILKERSRIHARDYEADDLIQKNKENGIERIGFLKSDGTKRTKIDDL